MNIKKNRLLWSYIENRPKKHKWMNKKGIALNELDWNVYHSLYKIKITIIKYIFKQIFFFYLNNAYNNYYNANCG